MLDNFREWLSDYLRYILLGLAVLLVIIIGVCIFRLAGGSSSGNRNSGDSGNTQTAVTTSQDDQEQTEGTVTAAAAPSSSGTLVQNDADLLALAQKYYQAVAAEDSATLATIVDPWNDTVEAQTFDNDIEAYENITTYSKDGPVDDSWLVYVYCECRIQNISTAVPSLRQLFVTRNSSGDLVISDWSQYQDFVTESNSSAEVQALITEVNERCQQLAETDADLKAYLESQGISTGTDTGEEDTESGDSQTSGGDGASASEGTATASDGVNVRSEASTNGTILGTLYPGQQVTVLGTESGWTHITYVNSTDGSTVDGYVSSDYLSMDSQ